MAKVADVVSIQSHGDQHCRYSPTIGDATERASKRNSMAIQNVLNPSDQDDDRKAPWSQSNLTSSSKTGTPLNPASTLASYTPELGDHESRTWTPASTQPTYSPELIDRGSRTWTPESSEATHTPELTDQGSRAWTPASTPASHTPEMADRDFNPDRSLGDLVSNDGSNHSSENDPKGRQAYRHPYDYEQDMFIWFFTTDVPLSRSALVDRYNAEWPGAPRNKTGIECRLYRLPDDYGFPKRRGQKGPGGKIDSQRWGMWSMKQHSYRWMDEYADRLRGESIEHMTVPLQRLNESRLRSRGSLSR